MVRKAGIPLTSIIGTPAPQPGGDALQGLDRISSDLHNSGVSSPISSEEGQENSNPSNGRGPLLSGVGTPQEGSSQGDRQLPIPTPTHPSIWKADNILQTIADRFTSARSLQKAEAWRQLQMDLMNASPFLVPHLLPLKDLIGIVSEIEKEIKGGTAHQGKSNEEIMADFLSGDGSLIVAKFDLAPSIEDNMPIDKGCTLVKDGGETTVDTPLSLVSLPITPPSPIEGEG